MKKSSKFLIFISCLFLVSIFFVPLWFIKLDAPQYPGGLDMFIWIHKITGTDEFTLQNINILNHYIGMEAINPESFAELKIMPYVLGFFCISGLLAIAMNSKRFLIGWLAIVVIGGTIGLVDFYIWQQAFGNNLDPQAPIKIEGMTYSPPFLGIKTILNIKATSFPHLGGLAFFLAIVAAGLAVYMEFKNNRIMKTNKLKYYAGVGLLATFISCTPQQQAIEYGFDACEHCKMTISDNRYGTELVTEKGKVYKFDSIECMADHLLNTEEETSYAMILVTDFLHPEKFIHAENAWYLQSSKLPSPMGMGLTAFESKEDAKEFRKRYQGNVFAWDKLKNIVANPQREHVQGSHGAHQMSNH